MNIHNNNIFNCSEGIRFAREFTSNVSVTYNNVIVKNSNQYVYHLFDAESVISGITSDYNILGRPIDNDSIIWYYDSNATQ